MSWIQTLYETYENCQNNIGNPNDDIPLLPICHTTRMAQIQITIDGQGNFLRASIISKSDGRTIIPCTEKSDGRTNTREGEPHPLCDTLQYVAADYKSFGGDKKTYHQSYLDLLSKCCASVFSNKKVAAILKYIQKRKVIQDLVESKVLHVGSDGKLLRKWETKNVDKPKIFGLLKGGSWQADIFVRWEVEIPNDPDSKVWMDRSIWESWIKYFKSTKQNSDICYVTGLQIPIAYMHPAKVRNDKDRAKLISSNDTENYTFRGRFTIADQACGVGFEVTQKAHNALRWLIAKQGYEKDGQAIVAWAISGSKIPDPMADTLGLFEDEDMRTEITSTSSTAQHLANSLSRLIAGYNAKLGPTDGIVVMGMDSATPGRMAITFYRKLTGSDFLERVQSWHESCAWWQGSWWLDNEKDRETNNEFRFVGAPSPSNIALAAYGRRIDDKLRKATVERILPCIVDGLPIPRDIVESAVRHVCNRKSFELLWEWKKALGITCAIYKKYHEERRRYNMTLETDRRTRDYLFGRLLAAADGLEGFALFLAKEKRETNAARLMQRFSDHPCSTWKTIELSLAPYKARLGGRAGKHLKVIDEVMNAFNTEEFISDKPLSGEFLIGYHCQRKDLWDKDQDSDEAQMIEPATIQ